MKIDKTTIVAFALCLAAITATLFARNFIYTAAPLPAPASNELGSDPYAGGRITIHYHERPPYYERHGGSVGGIIGNRINVVFNQAKIPLAWQKTPAKRQLEVIRKNERREGAAGWFRTPERETFAKYSHPIYLDRPTIALARNEREGIRSGSSLADTLANPQLRLLRKESYSYGLFIDTLIERYQPNQVVTSADNAGMLKMIHMRRADYFFIAEEEADDLLDRTSPPASAYHKITFTDMPQGNRRYILFSRRVESSTIARLNRFIKNYGIDEPNDGSTLK